MALLNEVYFKVGESTIIKGKNDDIFHGSKGVSSVNKQERWQRVLKAYGTVTKNRKMNVERMVFYEEDGTVEMVFLWDEDGEDEE